MEDIYACIIFSQVFPWKGFPLHNNWDGVLNTLCDILRHSILIVI
jgi:hypothetical protein